MTQQEWFAISPFHKVNVERGTTQAVRAVLHGGNGIDQRLVGEGEDANAAIEQALETRGKMREVLP